MIAFQAAYDALLRQLEHMPLYLQHALGDLPDAVLRAQPACDQMPLLEHLCHMLDCDGDLYVLRARRILSEEHPQLEPVDVSVWPAERGYLGKRAADVLARFARERAAFVETLRTLDETALSRVGRRADGQEISVLGIVAQIADHDWDHQWRIAAILREFAAAPHAEPA